MPAAGSADFHAMSETRIIKRVAIDRVTVGMFLEDVFDERGRLLYTENTRVTDPAQVERLKQRGVRHVFINLHKGADTAPSAESKNGETEDLVFVDTGASEREWAYCREIEHARRIHQESFHTVRETLKSIKMGKTFKPEQVEKASQEITQSILRNPDALVSLCQIKGHDEYTYEHCLHVGILISTLAHEMNYSQDQIARIAMGGLLHDIGKMRVPEPILNKPGKYEPWEFAIMKRHPEHGLAIIREHTMKIPDIAMAVIGQHHERYDGSGYPAGLTGSNIHEAALMGAVADVYDALTTDRIYREAWTPQKALATIFQGCDKEYSRMVVERFTKHMGIYPVGSFVRLTTGEMGVVTRVHPGRIMAPEVLVLFNTKGERLEKPVTVDLARMQSERGGEERRVEISVDPKPYNIRVADYISRG